MRIWDISEPISPRTAVFPGDTPFSAEWVMRMAQGDSCDVSTLRMSVHCGTHADAPSHYAVGGHDIAAADLSVYLGRCRVIAVRGQGDPPLVPRQAVGPDALGGVERVLLKTMASHDPHRFDPGFTALGPEAARAVVAAGVRLVGIDTPSMDHATSTSLDAHKILLAGRVALLENLDLSAVEPGEYELIALPLKIIGGDASPVRAILRELAAT